METCPTCGTPYGKRRRCYRCKPGYRHPSYGRKRTGEWRQCEMCPTWFYLPRCKLEHGEGRFCSRPCKHASMRGKLVPHLKHMPHPIGHRRMRKDGYIEVKVRMGRNGYELEHRVMMAQVLGRTLETYEHVHHDDLVRSHNTVSNFVLLPNADHQRLHNHGAKQRDRVELMCAWCAQSYQKKRSRAKESHYCQNPCRLAAMHEKARAYHAARRPRAVS